MRSSDPLLPYVSGTVVRRLMADPASALRSDVKEASVAALFADVSDSTRIVEGLAERDREGAERFSLLLDAYFTEVIETIWRFGGQVLKFDGDAVLAIWRVRRSVSLVQAVTQAAACAEAFQQRILELPTHGDGRLSLRAGVGAGAASIVHVSDGVRRSELFMIGPAMAETLQAAKAAERGAVAYGPSAARLLDNVDHRVNEATTYEAAAHVTWTYTTHSEDDPRGEEAVTSLFAPYVPEVVRVRTQDAYNMWLADLRTVTTMFVGLGLDGVEVDSRLFDAVALVMQQVERCGGDVARVGAQRNGVAVLAAFGLPPHAHEDDADRAARCATLLRDALVVCGIDVSIGVTTGRVICGPVGCLRRREYTMIGDAVNVAARLMNAANGSVLCDADTRQASRGSVRFGRPRTLAPRGRKRVVEVFESIGYGQARPAPGVEMVGRGSERERLDDALRELEEGGKGSVFVIEGEAGIGKSCLAAFAADRARALGLAVVSGGGEAIESQTPFHAWRQIVLALLGLPSKVDAGNVDAAASSNVDVAAIESLLVRLCGMDPQLAGRNAPLLGAVLGIHFQENAWTAQLSPQARVDQTMSLVVRILTGRARDSEHRDQPPEQHGARLVVMLEDAHWFDASSWGVLRMAAQESSSLLIIVTSRPNQASEYAALLSMPDVYLMLLTGLETQDIQTLAARRLGVASVPSPLVEFLSARSRGHPFFTEELLDALRRAGALLLHGGECRLPPQDLERLGLPRTVEGVVAGRIDALSESESSLLKVASILGGTFTAADVAVLDPACRPIEEILDSLNALVQSRGLLVRLADRDATFAFHHAIIQTVAYETVTFAQRRRFHRVAAESLATRGKIASAVLAYHWSRAVDRQAPSREIVEKAVAATEGAGEHAIRSFDNPAAVALFSDALALADLLPDVADARRRASWRQRLGEASYNLGLPEAAKQNLLAALDLLQHPMPASPAKVRAELALALLHQLAHRMLPGVYLSSVGATFRRDPDRIARLRQMAAINGLLGFLLTLMGESEAPLLANLRALNLADHVGPCPELAASAVTVGITAGLLLGRRVERRYFAIARRTAESIGDENTLGRIWWMRGFYLLSRARWDDALDGLDRSRVIFEKIGDGRAHETSVMAIGNTFTLSYRFPTALDAYMRGYRAAHARGDVQGEAWSHVGMSQANLVLGRHQETLAMLAKVEAWMGGNLKNIGDRASELAVLGMRAAVFVRENDAADALHVLQLARERLGTPIFMYHAVTGYTFLADAAMRLREAASQGTREESSDADAPLHADDSELQRLASDFERALWTFSRLMPIGRAQAWVWHGLRLWLDGRHRRARRAWDHGAAVASALKMPYDEALAHYEAGRHLSPGDPRRVRRLEQSRTLFERIDARYWVRRVESELARR